MRQARVLHTRTDGFDARTLVSPSGTLDATFVVGAGMVGASLRHDGAELLDPRGGVAKFAASGSTMGLPLLHPWANRLDGPRYAVAGRAVDLDAHAAVVHRDAGGLPMHGLLLGRSRFEVSGESADEHRARLAARLDFSPEPALLAAFPFPHRLELAIALSDGALEVETAITATAGVAVPVAFGFHPYFRLPGAERETWWLSLPVRERLVLDDRLIPTGAREAVGVPAGPLGERAFDDAFVAPDRVALAGGGRRLEVVFAEGYPFAQIYSPAGAPFLCIEPMTAPGNALVRGGPALPVVPPGGRFVARFVVRVERE